MSLGFIGCKDDDDPPFLGAKIEVTVKNLLGSPVSGKTVYLFEDTEPTASTNPSDAKKQVVTNDNGIAVFDLNFTELNIIESQTTLYFAVFYTIVDQTFIVDSDGVTVKRNDTKTLTLEVAL